jgi:hypothetical protein
MLAVLLAAWVFGALGQAPDEHPSPAAPTTPATGLALPDAGASIPETGSGTLETGPIPPGKRYWERSAAAMREVLTRLNNYSCIMHITRYEQGRRDPSLKQVDAVRLQVNSRDGAESFALPGGVASGNQLRDLVSTGLVSNGFFQGYAHILFVTRDIQRLRFLGLDGDPARGLLRYQFVMDPVKASMVLQLSARRSNVPLQGEFWISQKDFLLRRLVIENAVPVTMHGVQRLLYIMDWGVVVTPGGRFLLPQSAELWVFRSSGETLRNDVALAQCREYVAESTIRFELDEPDEDGEETTAAVGSPPSASTPPPPGFLPAGLKLNLRLAEKLNLASLQVGDVFEARLESAVKHRGKTLLAEGTLVQGRIRRLDYPLHPIPHTVLWLEFPTIRGRDQEYSFLADLRKRDPLRGLVNEIPGATRRPTATSTSAGGYDSLGSVQSGYRAVLGVGSFLFVDGEGVIPAGYGMEWETVSALQ